VLRRINVLATNAGNECQQLVRHYIGHTALTGQGVVAILRRRVLEAIDRGVVELEPGIERETVRSLNAHSFRVGLTQDLFAAGEDGSGIALAPRWSSPTTTCDMRANSQWAAMPRRGCSGRCVARAEACHGLLDRYHQIMAEIAHAFCSVR
jgi:hypothetical protein